MIIVNSEMFGTSEDEAPEFDHSEDAENGNHIQTIHKALLANVIKAKEIENLRQESQALNSIRQSMGSTEFPRRVFEKVFKDDINRLRSMEDMWKVRTPPTPLDFDELSKSADELRVSVAQQDQKVWTQAENFAVFRDR